MFYLSPPSAPRTAPGIPCNQHKALTLIKTRLSYSFHIANTVTLSHTKTVDDFPADAFRKLLSMFGIYSHLEKNTVLFLRVHMPKIVEKLYENTILTQKYKRCHMQKVCD